MLKFGLLSLLLLPVGVGCTSGAPGAAGERIERDYIGPTRAEITEVSEAESERRGCEAQLRQVLAEPALPGAPGFDAVRAELLGRAKAEPVLLVKTPEHAPTDKLEVQGYRTVLARSKNAWASVESVLGATAGRPQEARESLLKDGYLYAEDPKLAYALVSLVQPHQLFGHDRIWIQRGDQTLHAERRHGRYHYLDGPLAGDRVRLIHLDRLGFDTPGPALHRDVRHLAYRLGFDRARIRHVTEKHVVANLRYGSWWVPTVLAADGPQLTLECEILAPNLQGEVAAAKAEAKRRQRVVQGLRAAMLAQIDEGLPFDEPRREYGHQMDGKLRKNWLYAYMRGQRHYAFNGDLYDVFDRKGRPLTPQVCVDFLTDTLERASGTSWTARPEPPQRILGKLDFDNVKAIDRTLLRRVPDFVEFARRQGDWFDVLDVSPREQFVFLGKAERFYPHLERRADDFAPGDMVVIRGKTPWDKRYMHYHSFFIYESDPVTGMPLVVVGNAGKPSLRSWETEARRTPERSIHHRLRPKTEWLESILGVDIPEDPLPIAKGGD
jgi:hypothetical protein